MNANFKIHIYLNNFRNLNSTKDGILFLYSTTALFYSYFQGSRWCKVIWLIVLHMFRVRLFYMCIFFFVQINDGDDYYSGTVTLNGF